MTILSWSRFVVPAAAPSVIEMGWDGNIETWSSSVAVADLKGIGLLLCFGVADAETIMGSSCICCYTEVRSANSSRFWENPAWFKNLEPGSHSTTHKLARDEYIQTYVCPLSHALILSQNREGACAGTKSTIRALSRITQPRNSDRAPNQPCSSLIKHQPICYY